jgi:hypothetical protein
LGYAAFRRGGLALLTVRGGGLRSCPICASEAAVCRRFVAFERSTTKNAKHPSHAATISQIIRSPFQSSASDGRQPVSELRNR